MPDMFSHKRIDYDEISVLGPGFKSSLRKQLKDYAGHVVRIPIEDCEKQLMLNDDKYRKSNSFPSGTSAAV